jgi:hypothetical protein
VADSQDNLTPKGYSWWKPVARLAVIFIAAWCFGAFLNWFATTLDRSARPAGFGRGLVQGALMPMSLPNLLVGRDVEIYSVNNRGVSYKLGYTAGVNGCGALFFGFFFWRISRWRRRANACKPPGP